MASKVYVLKNKNTVGCNTNIFEGKGLRTVMNLSGMNHKNA